MNRFEGGGSREAKIRYLDGDFQVTSPGSFVRCAVTGEALRQTRQAIRRARRDHPTARLVVTGCAAEIDRAAIGAMDEVDGLVANAAKLDPRAWNIAAEAPPVAPARTRAFLEAHGDRMKAFARKEAAQYLPPEA